jgi:hypothetical protein
MKVDDLDPQRVGDVLLRLPVVSAQLGHATPRNSITYLAGSDEPEVHFVTDILDGVPTDQIVDKWYGGSEAMLDLIKAILSPEPEG